MDGEIDIRALFGLLRRRLQLIAMTIVAVLSLTTLFLFAVTPVYTATTLVMVDPSSKNLLDPDTQLNSSSSDNAHVDGEVELARSPNVLLSVIASESLINDPEFGAHLGWTARLLSLLHIRDPILPTGDEALDQALSKLDSMITVQRRGQTYLISIGARSEDPQKAARLANAVAAAYIELQLNAKIDSTLKSRDVLEARIAEARATIVASEGSVDRFIMESIGGTADNPGDRRIATLQEQFAQIGTVRQQTTGQIASAQDSLDRRDYAELAVNLADAALTRLEQERQSIVGQLDSAAAPDAVQLQERLSSLEAQIDQAGRQDVTGLYDRVAQLQAQEAQIRTDIRSTIASGDISADVLTRIYDLQQTAEIARRQYEVLLARSQDLQAQSALQIADSRIVSAALTPGNPSWPNTRLALLLAALAALGLGIGLALLYDNFIGGFVSEEQTASVLRSKVVSTVPRQKMARNDQVGLSDNMITSPLSAFSESIRRVRAALDQSLRRHVGARDLQGTVIMVTSTMPNEGKTTIALSLARSYALSGQRTLLIDCDLRKPSIHRQLDLEPSQGLLDFLMSNSKAQDLTSIMTTDKPSGMTAMLGSRRSNIPTDQLVASHSFQRLISAARQSFDVVVLDTPPLASVVDGMYIAPHADAIVFVVRWAATPQSDVRKAMATVLAAKAEDVEVLSVINQQEISAAAYSRKYGSYHTESA